MGLVFPNVNAEVQVPVFDVVRVPVTVRVPLDTVRVVLFVLVPGLLLVMVKLPLQLNIEMLDVIVVVTLLPFAPRLIPAATDPQVIVPAPEIVQA